MYFNKYNYTYCVYLLFLWMSYLDNVIFFVLPKIGYEHPALFSMRVSIICFHIVKWQYLNRVKQQFRLVQGILNDLLTLDRLCKIYLKEWDKHCWPVRHKRFSFWIDKINIPCIGKLSKMLIFKPLKTFMQWFLQMSQVWFYAIGECLIIRERHILPSHQWAYQQVMVD